MLLGSGFSYRIVMVRITLNIETTKDAVTQWKIQAVNIWNNKKVIFLPTWVHHQWKSLLTNTIRVHSTSVSGETHQTVTIWEINNLGGCHGTILIINSNCQGAYWCHQEVKPRW